jgi:Na+-translocating ferredoxin:NAD+ oxidoreductase RnfG subunit
MRTAYARLLGVALIMGTTAMPAMAIRYLTKEEALRVAIPNAQTIRAEQVELMPTQRQRVHNKANHPLDSDTFVFHVGKRNDQIDGYAYITDKKGRHRPITFVVGLKPDCRVREVAIMIYREPRGYEVKEKRFLRQYHNKTMRDPIEVNRDIKNISGATISAHSVSAGVREAVAICEQVFKP